MKTADFDFELPPELIALRPAAQRDGSRLLVLHRTGGLEHRYFRDIGDYIGSGDMLVLNDTKVLPVRLIGTKPSGGKADIILVKEEPEGGWAVLCRGRYEGLVKFRNGITAELSFSGAETPGKGIKRHLVFRSSPSANINDILELCGSMPLPPYIKRRPDGEDRDRYQTVYAEKPGSIAAPTAGLHFNDQLIRRLTDKGVIIRKITLHVGPGTFIPVTAEYADEHRMQAELFEIAASLKEEIAAVKRMGGRVIMTGTTATRALEGCLSGRYDRSAFCRKGTFSGQTDIFIRPGHAFLAADALITNFHLPCSTPLMLASAFCSLEKLMTAYREAIARGYRFFSYGDAMLIL
jgi:S-adenosylmethionine:tRNA ribosyltransferase-isomerase